MHKTLQELFAAQNANEYTREITSFLSMTSREHYDEQISKLILPESPESHIRSIFYTHQADPDQSRHEPVDMVLSQIWINTKTEEILDVPSDYHPEWWSTFIARKRAIN